MTPRVEEFYGGLCFDCYEFLGAHPAGRGWRFCIWAPHARRVQVLGDWNSWDLYTAAECRRGADGLWRATVPTARTGQLYKLNILCSDGRWRLRRDPFAFAFEPLPGTACRLARPPTPRRSALGSACCYDAPMNIYELHLGGWRRHPDGRYYTYDELAAVLPPWLLAHRYTHVEFLPLAEFPFDGSWGYQGIGYFAPSARFGPPSAFARLVDALHKAGIGVLMDFVPVHFAADDGALAAFDGEPLFEACGETGKSPWGSLMFDLFRPEVRSFLLSAAAFWLYRCRCDGLRVDAVGHALYREGSGWQAAEWFKTLTGGLHARVPGCVLIAEDSAGYLKTTAPTAYGGLGFDYTWDMRWLRTTLEYFSAPPESRPSFYSSLVGAMDAFYQELHLNALSHDENTWQTGTVLGRLWGSGRDKLAQARLLYFYQYLRPGKKLNFMGGELGQLRPFDADRELDWALLSQPAHRALEEYLSALGALYASRPALHREEYAPSCFAWVAREDAQNGVAAWLRMAGGQTLLCVMNTGPRPLPGYGLSLSRLCREVTATPVFSTSGPGGALTRTRSGWLHLDLAPFSAQVLQLD